MTKPTFSDVCDALECPHCGNSNLHQTDIRVWDREEDAKDCLYVAVVNKQAWIVPVSANIGNPSPRRQGMSVKFDCEHCSNMPVLNIYQHKGFTYIEWEMK